MPDPDPDPLEVVAEPVVGCLVVDGGGHILIADSAAAAILKAPEDALPGSHVEHWLPPAGTRWQDPTHGKCHAQRDNGVQLSIDVERHTAADPQVQLWRLTDVEALQRRTLLLAEQLSADTALRDLAHSLGHDLREPLRAVACYSELLSTRLPQPLDERTERYLGYLLDGARRLQRRVSAGVAYTRAARQLDAPGTVDVTQLVREELGEACVLSEAGAAPPSMVLGDGAKLRRALQHVLGYLRSRAQDGGDAPRIEAELTATDQEIVLVLRNPAMALSEDAANRVFRLFDRGREDLSNEATESSSPAIAQRIVEQHGGTLRLESNPDRGVAFFLRLPAH